MTSSLLLLGTSAALLLFAGARALGAASGAELPTRLTPVANDQMVPTSDFVRPLLFGGAELNPAGTRFAAFIANRNYTINVVVCDIASGRTEWTDTGADVKLFQWVNDSSIYLSYSRLLRTYTATGTRTPESRTSTLDLGEVRTFGTLGKPVRWDVYFEKTPPGALPGTDFIVPQRPTPEAPRGTQIRRWLRPADGSAAYALIEEDGAYLLYRCNGLKWGKLPVNLENFWPLDLGPDPGEMIGLGPRVPGAPRALQVLNVDTGAPGAVLYQDAKRQATGVLRGPGHGAVIGFATPQIGAHTVWLDPKRQKVQAMVDHFFPRSIGVIAGADRTETRYLIEEISDVKPSTYYLLDLDKHSVGLLKSTGPWIDPKRMRPTQVITYQARDGSPIEAYLTLPAGPAGEGLPPLVVLPHSGPWRRTFWGWDGMVQLLASRGYAVLQPNYRGSDGYDWAFPARDRWDFGKMSQDVSDGTKALRASGLVDPHRVAIMGLGFGGYLAVRGAIEEPDLYRAVVALGGVYDWDKAFTLAQKYADPVYDELRRNWGRGTDAEVAKLTAENLLPRVPGVRSHFLVLTNGVQLNIDDITARYGQVAELKSALPASAVAAVVGKDKDELDSTNQAFASWVDALEKIQAFFAAQLGR